MMPGGIDSSKRYSSLRNFARDERSMIRRGWTTQRISLRDRPLSLAQRLFRRPAGVTVDAHYLRHEWPTAPS